MTEALKVTSPGGSVPAASGPFRERGDKLPHVDFLLPIALRGTTQRGNVFTKTIIGDTISQPY
jgi:hypothetical protein